ncbi:hypothetical protein BGZ65_002655 [Modicella reniformis]|uniref:Uncharacterized protein n=1 Tax=Modicella reniformis TaxID=1440133 RepID=A0A9P6LT43_9FUNG|nr:hypothetical protein BGZ65_002655 [Modicella reniformis]
MLEALLFHMVWCGLVLLLITRKSSVALNLARILLTPLEELKKTILEKGRMKHVYGGIERGAVNEKQPLTSIELGINRLEGELGYRKAVATGETETFKYGLAFRTVGDKNVGIQGVPFHECKGFMPNIDGEVIDVDQNIVRSGFFSAVNLDKKT